MAVSFSLFPTFHAPTSASTLHTISVVSSHHSLELRPQCLHRRKFIANLEQLSVYMIHHSKHCRARRPPWMGMAYLYDTLETAVQCIHLCEDLLQRLEDTSNRGLRKGR